MAVHKFIPIALHLFPKILSVSDTNNNMMWMLKIFENIGCQIWTCSYWQAPAYGEQGEWTTEPTKQTQFSQIWPKNPSIWLPQWLNLVTKILLMIVLKYSQRSVYLNLEWLLSDFAHDSAKTNMAVLYVSRDQPAVAARYPDVCVTKTFKGIWRKGENFFLVF